jgi:hypothetical protein
MTLVENLNRSYNEKDVENSYRQSLSDKINGLTFTSPFGCDGYGEKGRIRILCEFKNDIDLSSKNTQCKVLAQSIYYLKKFEVSGKKLPTTIFVGDKNECFVVHTNSVFKYLSYEWDWDIAPSNAHTNIDLMSELMSDDGINPFIFHPKNIDECIEKIVNLTENVKRLVPITKHNITEVFKYFDEKVLGKKVNLDTNERANLFVQLLINPDENYLHPVKMRKAIVTKGFGEILIQNRDQFLSFFEHFSREYTPRQKEVLTAIVDRLVEDTTRRKQGEFFTPAIWVDKAHEYISSVFGDDWKEKYVVWDPAWGTGNLTRDYKFKELYVSTLNQSDIDTANQMGYNPEGVKFQFDFLNDGDEKLPQGLRDAIENGRGIIVLMNPPYARSASNGERNKVDKGISNTICGDEMKKEKWGSCSANIYAQFFYRTFKYQQVNKNIKIGIFCKPNYLSSPSYKEFRKKFFGVFCYKKGFLFQASHFSDVSTQWGINFAIFNNEKSVEVSKFEHTLIDFPEDTYELEIKGLKTIYNIDKGETLSNWVVNDSKPVEFPKLSSYLTIKETKFGCGLPSDCFSTVVANSNSVYKNQTSVYIVNGGITENVGKNFVNKHTFEKCVTLFTSRRLIKGDWINDKDEYLVPNEQHPDYEQFTHDSIVYSLFNNSSQQSSLRQVQYKDRLWDIKNEFFWMSKEDMMDLADQNHYTELYSDARTDNNRHVYKLLFGEERIYDRLSDDAREVLDMATELTKKSIKSRQMMADNHNHLNSWDSGYAQLKLVWKEYHPEEFKNFRDKYKEFEDRLRPMVYELGFLMK